ncbi:hypothetical protein PVAG01_03435 [Phlyctema vagabunda]|uniref:DUF2461 domain-containing protein n=1 Tax=Phlyctema vagabunda TaxID=108571 RepID=A0ABR4PLH5_9HELO
MVAIGERTNSFPLACLNNHNRYREKDHHYKPLNRFFKTFEVLISKTGSYNWKFFTIKSFNMAGTKRKASSDINNSNTARRQSKRATKTEVKYQESENGSDEVQSDGDFSGEVEEEEEEHDEDDDEKEAESGDPDSSEEELVKKGWTKTKGKSGRWEMTIKIPKEKEAGDTPYKNRRIHPNTLEFLSELKENNKREWLKFHEAVQRQAEKDFLTFIEKLSDLMYGIDAALPELPMKDIIYRIYRDMRFTNDPTPYKSYFSASWSRGGRKGPYAHYYLHIQPGGQSFAGGGYYSSDTTTLECIREDIDQEPHQLKSILTSDRLRNVFFPDIKKKDDKAVVAAFCAMNAENALKTKPKGYEKDHKDISLLKLRNFTLKKSIPDEQIVGEDAIHVVSDIFEAMQPFITHLNGVVLPDRD